MPWVWQTLWAIQNQVQLNMSMLITSVYFWIPAYRSHMLLFTECFDSKQTWERANSCLFSFLSRCAQMQPFGKVRAIISQFLTYWAYTHVTAGNWHVLAPRFPLDWSVIGTLHLLSAPNALWVFSRHDPIFPYFSPGHGKLTNNARISHCFYRRSLTFLV